MTTRLKISAALCFGGFLAISSLAQTPLVNHGDSWRYRKGTNAPQANWKTAADAGLDSTWLTGNGGFGYADNMTETQLCQTVVADMVNKYTTLYMRRSFTVAGALDPTAHLQLTMDFDDGFIVWLDGNYLTNRFITGAPAEPAFNALTSGAGHESSHGNNAPQAAETHDFGVVGSRLPAGTHVLAIIGMNNTLASSDLIQVPDLFVAPPAVPGTNKWYLTNSPIAVATSFVVGANSTLIIEPGVTVQFGAGAGLVVANGGVLLAEGTSNAPIHFTRSGASGYWGNITINGAVGSPESRIVHADFQFNANSTTTPCIEVNVGTAFLDHLAFGNTGAPYIHVDGASFVISHCHFPTATAQFELCHGTGGVKAGGHGLFLRNFFGKATGYNDVVDFTGSQRGSPIVHFINNVVTGGDDDGWDLDGTDAWVEGNIFLHMHKNAGTPDSSSAISGGDDSGNTSEVTCIGNIIYDCDELSDAKQGNFFTFFNNTFVHQTHVGGIDSTGAVVILADAGTVEGAGMYLEGNIIADIEQFTRNVTAAIVTFTNNLMPPGYTGLGGGNSSSDPMLAHIPNLSETVFTNWQQAQIMRDWFALLPGSPGIGTGPNGRDKGALVPIGASVSGAPNGITTNTSATLQVGFNRAGHGIPVAGWPNGSGYIAYKWRLDGGPWSVETPISTPIALNGLAGGPHYVEVSGKRDSLLYQDDPLFGEDAVVSRSPTWTVQAAAPMNISNTTRIGNTVSFTFTVQAGLTYTVLARDALDGAHPWVRLANIPAQGSTGPYTYMDTVATPNLRFYQVVTPAYP